MNKLLLIATLLIPFYAHAEQRVNAEGYPIDEEGYVIMDSSENEAYMTVDPRYVPLDKAELTALASKEKRLLQEAKIQQKQDAADAKIQAEYQRLKQNKAIARQKLKQDRAWLRHAERVHNDHR